MATPRLKVTCDCPTQAQFDQFKASVEAEMPAARKIAQRVHNWDVIALNGIQGVLDAEFKVKADADATWAKLVAKTASLALLGKGLLRYHQCPHADAVVTSCTMSGYTEQAI